MISFFEKKVFLADHLHGLVDIHNHILPGIDDGAKTVEDSIGMLKEFSGFGVNRFICTPHIMHNYYDNSPKTIKESYLKLEKEIDRLKLSTISLDFAAEHMIDDNFETILEKDQIMPIGKTHLLVEMSYLQPSINFDIAISKIQSKQLHPIFAHPERYIYLHKAPEKYGVYKKEGIKFQLNLLSITGYYGKSIQKMALKLLNDNAYDFVASDAHNIRHIKIMKESTVSKKTIALLDRLTLATIEEFL